MEKSDGAVIEDRLVIAAPDPDEAPSWLRPYILALHGLERLSDASVRYRLRFVPSKQRPPPETALQIAFIEVKRDGWTRIGPNMNVRTLLFVDDPEELPKGFRKVWPNAHRLPGSPSQFAGLLASALREWDGRSGLKLPKELLWLDVANRMQSGKPERKRLPRSPKPAPAEPRRESFLPEAESDQPTAKDHLGFTPYVQGLARFLAAEGTKPPLTVSVEGEWGSGKSSFMLQLRDALEAEPALQDGKGRVFSVWFNPWRHDRGESMWAAFALHFIRELEAELSWWERLRARVALAWNRRLGSEVTPGHVGRAVGWVTVGLLLSLGVGAATFLGLQHLLGSQPAAWAVLGGAVAAPLAGFTTFAQWAANAVRRVRHRLEKELRSPDYAGRAAFIEEFHEDFRRIVAAYAGVAAGQGPAPRVFVFVDDLDRCDVPRAAELMQAINLLIADDPRIVFLLGMDRQKVAAGIAVKHSDLLPFLFPDAGAPRPNGLRYGYSFIEKFIQIPFALPTPTKGEVALLLRRGEVKPAPEPQEPQARPDAVPASLGAQATDGVAGDAPAQQPQTVKPEPAVQQRRRLIEVTFDADSDAVHDLALRLAPCFGSNPRRIKQFVNLFRLRGYIATRTGLFDLAAGQDPAEALTLEQFGKFVALSLRFPLVVEALGADPGLLAALQEAATQPAAKAARKDPRAQAADAWRAAEPGLLDLLAVGLGGPDGGRYDMRRVDAAKLMRVSPALPTASSGAKPSVADEKGRALEIYRSQLEFLLRNGPMGLPQEAMLLQMRKALGISDQEADELRRSLERSLLRMAA